MRITLVRFRCYIEPVSYEFAAPGLTLLVATSGKGKTTLLEGALWCLYGGMRDIYPRGSTPSSTNQTCVLLELPELGGLYIRRHTHPATVEVGVPDGKEYKSYKDEAAQALINHHFGSKELFLGSCYIVQDERCPLIALSSAEKFTLLHEFTYGGGQASELDMPDYYLEKVDTELQRVKQHLAEQTGRYNMALDAYTQSYTSHQGSITLWTENRGTKDVATELAQLEKDIDLLEMTVKHLQEEYQKAREQEVRREETRNRLFQVASRLKEAQTQGLNLDALMEERKTLDARQQMATMQQQLSVSIAALERKREALNLLPVHVMMTQAEREQERLVLERSRRDHETFNLLNVTPTTYLTEIKRIEDQLASNQTVKTTYTAWELETKDLRAAEAEQRRVYDAECMRLYEIHEGLKREQKQVLERNASIKALHDASLRERNLLLEQRKRYETDLKRYTAHVEDKARAETDLEVARKALEPKLAWWSQQYGTSDVKELPDKRFEATLLLREEVCPHCAGGISFQQGTVAKGHSTPQARLAAQATLQQLAELEVLLTRHQTATDTVTRCVAVSEPTVPPHAPEVSLPTYEPVPSLPGLSYPPTPQPLQVRSPPPKDLDDASINRLLKYKGELEALSVPAVAKDELLLRSASILRVDQYVELGLQVSKLQQDLRPCDWTDADRLQMRTLDEKIRTQQQLQLQINVLTTESKALEETLATMPLVSSVEAKRTVDEAKQKSATTATLLAAGKIVAAFHTCHKQLEDQHAQVTSYATYESNLLRIKALVSETSTNAMDEVVAALNETANLILKDLFFDVEETREMMEIREARERKLGKESGFLKRTKNNDIRVMLATHRTLKTKDKTKLEVNLQVSFAGEMFSYPGGLSGGEKDRISFALTLAMAKLNPSPILFLDEAMRSLDEPLRDQCTKALRLHLSHKTIVHVCHEVVKGFHDDNIFIF
ncbi:Hypothetical protein POVN_LOCUS501 [uncultured virus]|nr:Hypothetical protein POVN_LOCUS501 [uncultured virus]